MAENKKPIVKYFSFYPSYRETIDMLSDEKKLAAYEMLTDYGLYGIEPDDCTCYELKLIFSMAKATIDSSTKNILNGCKGGRPRKENAEKTMDITPVKTLVNTKKEKEKEKEKENIPFTSPYKEDDTPAPSADAGAASTSFTFADVKQCAEENSIELTEKQLGDFYSWMEKYNWTISGRKVTKLENALSGYAKKHKSQVAEEIFKPDSTIEDSIYTIAKKYITKRRFKENAGGAHTLISKYVPKECFSTEQLEFMADEWQIWPLLKEYVLVDEYWEDEE